MSAKNIKSVCPYCGVGCGIVMSVENNRVIKVSGDKTHPSNAGRLCTKGTSCAQAITQPGRMNQAYLRTDRQQPLAATDIDKAIQASATRLRQIIDKHGPDAVALYISGQMSLEAQYLANKLVKGFIRTNNIESNSRLCMASASSGYKLSLGADAPPGSYDDIDNTDLFFVIGANMADCHPILFLRMMDRVKAGAKLIVVDPRRTGTADKADIHLQIKSGTDIALLNGILHLLIKHGHTATDFIAQYTEGWEEMPAFVQEYTPARVAAITGLSENDIIEVASLIGSTDKWLSCWTMGLNQSSHGTWNVNSLCNLHLATGSICRPGCGPFSLTGQPNAMGGREMGYMGTGLPGQRSALEEDDRRFIEQLWQIPHNSLSTRPGGGTIALFEDMAAGNIKACWIICTNPVATIANRAKVIAGLQAAELVICQDAFLENETNSYADILLPGALWAEAEGVMINSERNLTLMQKAVEPPGEAMADWQIIARVASAMGYAHAFSYATAAEVFAEITRCHNDKTGYDLRGASYSRLQHTPLQWPCADSNSIRSPIRYLNDGISQTLRIDSNGRQAALNFPTDTGKARFLPRPHMDPAEMPDTDFPLILNTGRLQHQWHTLTKTGKIATLNKLNPGPFIEIHPDDALPLGIHKNDQVEVRSRRGKAVLPALISDRVRPGSCFSPFHWNDLFGENLAINAVTNDAVDPISLSPEFKVTAVTLCRIASADTANSVTEKTDRRPAQANPKNTSPTNTATASLIKLLDLDDTTAISLATDERDYMQGFVAGLNLPQAKPGLPVLPDNAPLPAARRRFINGVLAGLFSRSEQHEAATEKNKVTLLWASQTGNAEQLAIHCSNTLEQAGITVQLASMDNFTLADMANTRIVLFVTSTFGDGDAPDNGSSLWQALENNTAPALTHMQYAILALGDSSYDQFCGFGRKLDLRLAELGAKQLAARLECEADNQQPASAWLDNIIHTLQGEKTAQTTKIPGHTGKATTGQNVYSRNRPFPARLVTNTLLSKPGAAKEIRQFGFDIGDSGIQYSAGDALGIWPVNCPAVVGELLDSIRLKPDTLVKVPDIGEMPIADALLSHYDITRIGNDFLRQLQQKSGHTELAERLAEQRSSELKNWLWGQQLSDMFRYVNIGMSGDELLPMLKRLQPRLYSISSSPLESPAQIQLTVSTVRFAHAGNIRHGVCSGFLADRADQAAVPVFVQASAHFHPPENTDTPMIMIGPGTGIAPFIGFLQERRATQARGKNWLFFGEQRAATDFYYQHELQQLQQQGYLHQLDTAFSRDQPEKVYVQHRMLEHGKQLWKWLNEGACFYVCGDASRMAKDVDNALKQVIMQHGQLDSQAAEAYVNTMSREKRYLRDVY